MHRHFVCVALTLAFSMSCTTDSVHAGQTDAGGPPPNVSLGFEAIELPEPLDRPTAMAFVPGKDGEFLVLEQRRRVEHYVIEADEARLLGSFEVPNIYTEIDCGLISLAFDPDYEHNHFFYVGMCVSKTASGVFRFSFDDANYSAISDSMREIIVEKESEAKKGIHNVGSIGFDAKDRMWVLFGDKEVSSNASDPTNNLGGIVRIDPSREPDAGGYEPAGNVFDENPDLIAYGFRSPWRGAMDKQGRLFVGDVGEETTEEVDLVHVGGNHGWPKYQGPCRRGCGSVVNPLTSWTSDDDDPYVLDDPDAAATTRRAAWVGPIYEDRGNDRYAGQLDGRLLIGDMCSGFVRMLVISSEGTIVHDVPVGHRQHLTGGDQASDGYLYVLTYGSCAHNRGRHPGGGLYRIVLAN